MAHMVAPSVLKVDRSFERENSGNRLTVEQFLGMADQCTHCLSSPSQSKLSSNSVQTQFLIDAKAQEYSAICLFSYRKPPATSV